MEELAKKVLETANEINKCLTKEPGHPNFIPLRDLNQYCKKQLFSSSIDYERFLCFIISEFINNFFSNFGSGAEYDEELQSVKVSFFEYISKTFFKLGDAINNENQELVIEGLSELINEYINKINFLNRNF